MKASESDVESSIIIQLQSLGWQADIRKPGRNVFRQTPQTPEESQKLGRLRPDFILYAEEDSARPSIVIEAKKPNQTLAAGLEQGRQYAELLNAPVVIATDGYRIKTWHMRHNSPLFYNDREVDELVSRELARHFISHPIYSSFSRREALSKKDLIGKFKKANDILRTEGLDAGIVRFSEFANLMFLKLKLENGGHVSGHTWADLESKRGAPLLEALKSMLAELRSRHRLFEQTKIKTPARLEALVSILSSFQLSGVRDDIKGVAFETFIHSYTQGLKNDLGQYFTPRHIIKLMVDYLRPQIGETVYDPFCGTGGMLIESFRYIQQHIDTEEQRQTLCRRTVYGRDISSVSRIAMMNMIMFGDGNSNIEQGDSYRQCDGGKYDIVITNIPFSQSTEFTEGYPVAASGEKNGDSIGVQHCLASLKDSPAARAAIIVPIGFIYKRELRREREYIHRHFDLEQVAELTPKCFNPYTEQQTAVLMLRRRAKRAGETVYYRVKNDGFSQDGYRVQMPGANDLDKVMEKDGGEIIDISAQDDWKYKKIAVRLRKGEHRLGDLTALVKSGNSISPKTMLSYTIGGEHPIVMVADLSANHIDYDLDEFGACINDRAVAEKRPYLYPRGTIIIPTSGKAALLNHRALLGKPSYLSGTVTGIVAKEGMHPYYLFYWLLRWDAEAATYDLGYPGLSPAVIKEIAIPRLSRQKEEQIIADIAQAVALHKQLKTQHRHIMGRKA